MQIYVDVGVSFLRFPKLCFWAKYILFHIQKIEVKNFIVVVTLLNFSYTFPFSFSMSLLYLLLCEEFLLLFRWLASFWWFFFHFFNTWKSHYRQLQVLIMIFNKNVLVNTSSFSNSKNPPWNLLSFVSKIVVNECLKNSVLNYFNFVLISNYW